MKSYRIASNKPKDSKPVAKNAGKTAGLPKYFEFYEKYLEIQKRKIFTTRKTTTNYRLT